jgi:hypothetical protein
MYSSVDFSTQIVAGKGSLLPQTRRYQTLIWLIVTSKLDYYYYYLNNIILIII